MGYGYVAGLEVELYITRVARSGIRLDETGEGQPGPAPEVEVFQRGYQFLSDARLDGIGDTLEAIRDGLWDVGLPPRSIEDEWGPGQIEFTYGPMEGLAAADAMVLFRSAVKAICQRRGLLASFMCWPALPNFFPCGWHLHQSLVDAATGANGFVSDTDLLTALGRQFVAGLLESAPAMAVFGDPTVNAYARFRPYSFAPDRVAWAADNRGALIRVQGGPGDPGTHVENRLGEPAANPYLWLAANIAAGLDGIVRGAEPPPIVTGDPYAADGVAGGADTGGALTRVGGGPGDPGTHVETRLGDPAANPYLWLAANIAAGLDGIVRGAEPPPIVTGDPYAAEGRLLPQSLGEAVEALAASGVYRAAFGDALIDYLVMMKRSEIEIHAQANDRSAWEMAEYFEIF